MAEDVCPGHPDALGTSRVLTISPDEFTRIGSMQYKQTLPLADHEVVITFDDGPLPPYSNIILDTLASQCVKVTYFIVGQMAKAYPWVLRRMYNDGHTIGTHSLDHPLGFERLALPRVEHEVEGGIANVDNAIGDPKAVSPFFRIPGLGRSKVDESFLASQHLVTWSADVVADDWFRGISAQQIVKRAMRRLDAKGRGILLLHDIHPATAMALPTLLKELKTHGYHVVQVVAKGERPPSVPILAAAPDKGAWPRVLKSSADAIVTGAKPTLRHQVKRALAGKHHGVVASARAPAHDHAASRSWPKNWF
ncbi:MAG TPA: polysaccharide deacetylase family protein [Pseudolabrys sp.]|nr:polysaccharide deacetylase family protein [Pseudolabrys sp.]